MNPLAKADRQALTYGVAGSLALTIGGGFWALPHIEDELDEEAAEVASYVQAEGFEVEWNGRDGYLTVPAGTPKAAAEAVAADLADISGTRDVEVVFASAPAEPATVEEEDADQEVADEVEAEPVLTPAQFQLDWAADTQSVQGEVPTEVAEQLSAAFPESGWDTSGEVTLDPVTTDALVDVVAPLVGTDIESGRMTVTDDEITVVGVVADTETLERLTTLLEADPTVSEVELTVAEAPLSPANFAVTWDAVSVQQSGTAPVGLDGTVASLGIGEPITRDDLTVDDGVEAELDALAPLVGTTLISGRADVVGGALTVSGVAATEADRDAALAALGDADAAIEVSIGDARSALVAAVLQGVEFETNTNVPTAETEGVIDELAAVLQAYPDIAIEIIGHTDSRGDDEANQALSESRAGAVLDGLVARGIDASRLSASGQGETEPADSNETVDGRQNNRRVEIEIKENN